MPKRSRKTLRLRRFLNPLSSELNSYISVVCESSDDGEYVAGNYLIHIADCRRIIELEFALANPRELERSLKKIDLLLDTLTTFKAALYKEAELIKRKRGR